MKLTTNFQLSEFSCKDGTRVPDHLLPNVMELAKNLQVIRNEIGEGLSILSGYRTPSWNKKVGGASNSQHLQAKAADLTTKSLRPRKLHAVIMKLIKERKIKNGGVGLYPGFVHYDVRDTPARW
jgi:uncharacterized protein YcbK (DUF882 family)